MEICLLVLKHIELKNRYRKCNDFKMIRARDIAKTYRISENFVAKILQLLCREKIIASKQGVQGGYYLNVDLEKVTFLDLVEKVEGKFNVINCISSDESCVHHSECSIIDSMRELNDKFRDFYQSLLIHELITIPFRSSSVKNDSKSLPLKEKERIKSR